MLFLKTFFKTIFCFLVLLGFFKLVDLTSLSFKTIIPKSETRIELSENTKIGAIRNLKDISEEKQIDFQGNNQEIIDLVNEARIIENLGKVTENEKLKLSAMEKAQHMKDNNYFEHISPQGLQPWYFVEKQNYSYKAFGENLAEGYFSAQSVHTGWMNSPGHRENILSKKFNEIGVAILEFQQEGRKSYLIVQHFGTKLTPQDLITEIVCDKKSKENCEEAEDDRDDLKDLIEEQEKIIKKAEEVGVRSKDLNRLEENLDDLEDAEEELEDYLDECEKFMDKCDRFE